MNLELLSKNSIILSIGDFKLSDTADTFEKEGNVDKYCYKPIIEIENYNNRQITANIAYGDCKRRNLYK